MKKVKIALVGVGGYGHMNFQELMRYSHPERFELAGVIDPYFAQAPDKDQLEAMSVPVFETLEAFYGRGYHADLAILSTPIVLHCPQTCEALSHGSYVMCEKPLGATVQEALAMKTARDRTKKWVAIGYQWSFSRTIQRLKADIQKGLLGMPRRLKTMVMWPREHNYYRRNNWAGARQDRLGRWILDSPINNAVAHYLHNMFYLLGEQVDRSASLQDVQGELYRVNAIENFDTGFLRTVTEQGVEILFYATHACRELIGPRGCYEFENAVVTFAEPKFEFVVRYRDGREVNYGSPNTDAYGKVCAVIESILDGKPPVCGIEAAMTQTLCMNGLHESVPQIGEVPEELVHTGDILNPSPGTPIPQITWIEGVDKIIADCYEKNLLPAEASVSWAQTGDKVPLLGYQKFPQRPQR